MGVLAIIMIMIMMVMVMMNIYGEQKKRKTFLISGRRKKEIGRADKYFIVIRKQMAVSTGVEI